MDGEKATSLRRGLAILVALGDDHASDGGGLGVVQLSELVASDKSRVSRTLRTLAEYDLVERDAATRAYRVGWRVYALARRAGDARLLSVGTDAVERLVRRYDEGAHLSVRSGREVLTIVSRAPTRALSAADALGSRTPLHCTSAGQALLLDHDAPALDRVLGGVELPPAGPRAARDAGELARRLATARSRGFVTVDEESEAGVVAVAAPIRGFDGQIAAALNLSAPKFRFIDALAEAGRTVADAAEEVSAALGWRPRPDQRHESEASREEAV